MTQRDIEGFTLPSIQYRHRSREFDNTHCRRPIVSVRGTGEIRLLSRTASLSNGPFQPLYPIVGGKGTRQGGGGRETSFKEFPILSFSVAPSTSAPVREMGYRNEWYSVYSRAKLRCSAPTLHRDGAARRAAVASRHWTRSKMGLRRNWKAEFSLYPLSARETPHFLSFSPSFLRYTSAFGLILSCHFAAA